MEFVAGGVFLLIVFGLRFYRLRSIAKAIAEPLCSVCQNNRTISKRTKVTILGETYWFDNYKMCKGCTRAYMEKYATTCAHCEEPILVGEAIGHAPDGSKHPYTHLSMNCSPMPGLYCGHWGEGKPEPLKV